MDNYLDVVKKEKILEIENVEKCNKTLERYGMYLSEADIKNIVSCRNEALSSTHRLEIGNGILEKIIIEFCDSQFIEKDEFVDTISELIEIFYFYKNETKDLISDDELIDFMKKSFEQDAGGSVEYLKDTLLAGFAKAVLGGRKYEWDW